MLCKSIDRPGLAADARFADFALRSRHMDVLGPLVQEALLARGTDEWLAIFRAADVLASRIHDMTTWLDDPQVRGMEVVAEEAPPGLPAMPVVKIPGVAYPQGDDPRARWPAIGADGDAVLADALGLAADEIARLRAGGALGAPPGN